MGLKKQERTAMRAESEVLPYFKGSFSSPDDTACILRAIKFGHQREMLKASLVYLFLLTF